LKLAVTPITEFKGYFSFMSHIEPQIVFVNGLEATTNAYAESIVWLHQIHIDAKYLNDWHLLDIIKHEKKHHYYLWKAAETEGLKRLSIILWNNVWDFYDCIRLQLNWFFKKEKRGKN
jgi:hypothetical protein